MYSTDDRGAALVTAAAELASSVLAEHAANVDHFARFPTESIAALRDAGLFGLTVPTEFGGQGQSPATFAGVVEQLAQACSSTAMIYVMHVAGTQAIIGSSTLGNRSDVLTDIAAGRHLTTLAFSERGSRSQFWAPVSQLKASGEDFVTTATKSWITSASQADSYVTSAQQPAAASPLESTIYLLDRKSPGIELETAFDGLGLRGNDSAAVQFRNVSVPADNLLTDQGAGADMMLQIVLPWFIVGTSAMANGLSCAAVSATAGHLSGARIEPQNSALRDLPNLRARVARMSVMTEQARALLSETCRQLESPGEQTPLLVLQTRLAAIEAAVEVTDLAMKACGGAAFSKHLTIERLFRDARAGWVMAPTADHLRDFIGRALTGLPLF